jgi:hypothetical protein
MIPVLASVRLRRAEGRCLRFWVPLVLVWLLLLPFVVLLLPVLVVACLATAVNPLRALWIGWQILTALGGTRVEIGDRGSSVTVHIL